MTDSSSIESVLRIYDSLPPEAQHLLLEKLVSEIPQELTNKVLPTLQNVQSTYRRAPKLDIKLKSKEVQLLLDDLTRDAKISSFQPPTSSRSELIAELTHTLTTSWLNDIWSSVVEHAVQFQLAHRCLLFIAEVCVKVGDHPGVGGCKCPLRRPPLFLQIRRMTTHPYKPVKNFSLHGLYSTPRALLWIWRALFLSMLSRGPKGERGRITEMLQDMEDILGWRAVASVAVGGKGYSDVDDADEDIEDKDEEDEEWLDTDLEDDYQPNENRMEEEEVEEDDEEEDEEEEEEEEEDDPFLPELEEHIAAHLINLFSLAPSLALYEAIINLRPGYASRLMDILDTISGSTADTFLAALEIWSENNEFEKISNLLWSHGYLLRARDASAFQGIISQFSKSPSRAHHQQVLEIIKNECRNLLCLTASLLRSTLPALTTPEKQADLKSIFALRPTTLSRAQRITTFVGDIMPSLDPVNGPGGMFAAMMMGLPPPSAPDEEDMLNFVELDERDADLAEVKERWRPKIADRWEGWMKFLVDDRRKGPKIAREIWKWIEDKDEGEKEGLSERDRSVLALLNGSDIIDEIVERMNERGLKPHLAEALDVLSRFCKRQRSKARQQAKSSISNTPAAPPPAPANSAPGSPSSAGAMNGHSYTDPMTHYDVGTGGGLDDVD